LRIVRFENIDDGLQIGFRNAVDPAVRLSRMNRPNFSINAESMWIASNASTPSNALLDYASMLAGLRGLQS
jgi:hypothetical protein